MQSDQCINIKTLSGSGVWSEEFKQCLLNPLGVATKITSHYGRGLGPAELNLS